MSNKILKVCKIDSLTFASFVMKQKVDFLGIHVLEKRNIGEHKELTKYIQSNNGQTIIVTKIQDELVLQELIHFYKPTGIQFHFEIQLRLLTAIKKLFPNLILFGVITNDSKCLEFNSINTLCNYLIYDTSYVGGTNKKNNYILFKDFPNELKEKTLLAGKVSAERLIELESLNAKGYDIQSYFRDGVSINFKNLDKVCDIIKFPRKKMISISLTDIPLMEIHQASYYHLNSNLEYHLDFSDTLLYSTFSTADKSIDEKQRYLTTLPCSIHLFIRDEEEIRNKIKIISQKYPLNVIRIFIQYFKELNLDLFKSSLGNIKLIPSIYYKDLQSFISYSADIRIISIIVPSPDNKTNMDSFIKELICNKKFFEKKEVWLDRNLQLDYIRYLKKSIGNDFNFIIGKSIINDWSQIEKIYECVSK